MMKRNFFIFCGTLVLCVGGLGGSLRFAAAAQGGSVQNDVKAAPTPTPNYPLAPLRREFKNGLPFPAGEKLEYEVRFSRFPIYATVGVITFEYLGPTTGEQATPINGLPITFQPVASDPFFRFRASAISKGILVAIAGVDVTDKFDTLVDTQDFSTRLSFKEIKEGKKHFAQATLFDRAQAEVRFTAKDLNRSDTPPREVTVPRQDGMLDLLSAIYFVRLQKLKEGQLIRFPVGYDGERFTFDILVGKHEKLKTECGNVKTIKIEPKLFGPGQLFSRSGEMTMWLSDDSKQVPLRAVAKTSSGTVTAKLLNFKKNCQLIDPEEKKK